MLSVIALSVTFIGLLCVLTYRLATCALSFMLAFAIARFAYGSGAGPAGAGIAGLVAGAATFGALTWLFDTVRQPFLRVAIALIVAIPAAGAGYALVHGITEEAVASALWQQIFCIAGGLTTGLSSVARLAAPSSVSRR